MRKWFTALLILVLLMTVAAPDEAEARRRWRKRKALPVINEKKLIERIGGAAVLRGVVDDWTKRVLSDSTLGRAIEGLSTNPASLQRFRTWLQDQTCELADGPCTPAELKGLEQAVWVRMTENEFLVFADHLVVSLETARVGEREKNELLARWGAVDRQPESAAEDPAN
jgi:hypothetical protein